MKDFLKKRKTISLQELTSYFCKNPQIIRCMLEHWIRKGKVSRLIIKSVSCNNNKRCQSCLSQISETYQWIDKQT
nr:FeoC-like transcriptional regulator [Coxiella endosymbiont of Amblyomma americanum]